MRRFGILMSVFFLLCTACQREEKFPVEPVIEFISLEKIDDSTGVDHRATLSFHFQDGDGDVGLDATDTDTPFDTASTYYYNCFIHYYKKVGGQFQLVEFDGINFNQRIPRLSKENSESIEGVIRINLDINSFDYSTPTDTIKYSLYIVDRALHESNTIETTELVVHKR